MLIRVSGYNTGAQEYLEKGIKSGREFTRDELDHRLILDGQLSVTREVYESIPNHGQDRYLTITMSFKEDHVDPDVLKAVTAELKQFLMHPYRPEEFNFYAEAHLPKIKQIQNKKTGEMIDRKPHIHVVIPRINLLSGNEANPVDVYMKHEKYFEAFQEYINQKYGLASPRENIRADIEDAASVLSRYKADDFNGKNRAFKQNLVTQVIERGINSRADFYALVAEYGETRIRNEGKDNEYLSVTLPGDAKGTNLKETIFQDEFIVRRSLKKAPLDPAVIQARLQEWPQRSREIKYIHKMASPAFRERYWDSSPEDRKLLLAEREQQFYQTYGSRHDDGFISTPRDHQRSPAEAEDSRHHQPASSLPDMSSGPVADDRQAVTTVRAPGALLLHDHAHVHLGQEHEGRNPRLRPVVPGAGRGRGRDGATRGSEQPATVPARAARERASGSGRGRGRPVGRTYPGGTQSGGGSSEHSRLVPPYNLQDLPADARNPHRVRSMADIERRGRRLFAVADGPDMQTEPVQRASSGSGSAGQRGGSKKRRRFKETDPRPPHARNPYRVGSMAEIKARSHRLFDPSGPVDPARLVKRPSFKSLQVNRRASTVAAYFTRQAEQNQLMPAQRHALRRINKQYFDLRRSVFSDPRLTRQDKAQLVSVLTFERLKAREAIQNPHHNQEVVLMGSAEIRKLIKDDEQDAPAFSFSGPRRPNRDMREPEGVRIRVKRVLDKFSQRLDPAEKERDQARERELNAKDLYTRKAKFGQNVHYLDKKTDKTLFVDTGKAIVMRRTGITESGVAVALELAKERFGSTLSINGTAQFKQLVVEAAAKNGIDVHFTDKAMNQALTDRRAELDIEREGQGIARPSEVEVNVMQGASPTPTAATETDTAQTGGQPVSEPSTPVADSVVAVDAGWLKGLNLSEADIAGVDVAMEMRGEYHANWLVGFADTSPEAVALITQCMENDAYRESFKRTIEDLYGLPTNSPQDIQALDAVTGFVEDLVHAVENRKYPDHEQSPGAAKPERKLIEGTLVAHGSAPYQHNEKLKDKPPSYFATLKLDSGDSRTVWGVGLEDVLGGEPAPFQQGERIRLIDLGTVPVKVPVTDNDGLTVEKVTHRREWGVESLEPAKAQATTPVAPGTVAAAAAPVVELVKAEPERTVQPVQAAPPELVIPVVVSAVVGAAVAVAADEALQTKPSSVELAKPDQSTATPSDEAVVVVGVADSEPEIDPQSFEGWAEGWAPDEAYTDGYIQIEEGPEMD